MPIIYCTILIKIYKSYIRTMFQELIIFLSYIEGLLANPLFNLTIRFIF